MKLHQFISAYCNFSNVPLTQELVDAKKSGKISDEDSVIFGTGSTNSLKKSTALSKAMDKFSDCHIFYSNVEKGVGDWLVVGKLYSHEKSVDSEQN